MDRAQRFATPERAAQGLQQYVVRVGEPAATPKAPPPDAALRAYQAWLERQEGASVSAAASSGPRPAPAKPAALAAAPAPARPADVTYGVEPVELVPVEQPRPLASIHGKTIAFSRREIVLIAVGLGVGIGAVIAIGTIIWLVSALMSR